MAASPPPVKPPRGIKYGKDEAGCGFLVNVIKSLGFSETNEERQNEKLKIEKEFKKSDQRLNDLVSKHDHELSQVIPLFTQVTSEITTSRERIHAVKENLSACKRLLQCRRDELQKMWIDAIQQKHVLSILEQINELRKVPQNVAAYTAKRQYLHASKTLKEAWELINEALRDVEGLSDLRVDLITKRQQLYQRLNEELIQHLYYSSSSGILADIQQNSNCLNSSFKRDMVTRRSTDRMEANARVRKALQDIIQGKDLSTCDVVEDTDLIDQDLSTTYFITIIVECFGILGKIPESVEKLRIGIQSELLEIVRNTTIQMKEQQLHTDEPYSLLKLLDIVFKQFKAIAAAHALLLKNFLAVTQKYKVAGPQHYDLTDFWTSAQSVLQLLLTDYLDIQNTTTDDGMQQSSFLQPINNLNSYFSRRKVPNTKQPLFKLDKSAINTNTTSNNVVDSANDKQHRRNASDVSVDNLNLKTAAAGSSKSSGSYQFQHQQTAEKLREKLMICTPDQNVITKIYLPLMGYMQEIEGFMKCKPGQACSLHDFIDNYIKGTFLPKGYNTNLQMTIEGLSKNQDVWRTIISVDEIKYFHLSRPILQSTARVDKCLMDTKQLIHDLPNYSEELLKSVCSLLKDYREICQAAYRGIVQPDAEDKRIYSVAWLKDEDISRFLKTLPNWTDLKNSNQVSKQHGKKMQRNTFEVSEEENPLQVQQRNIREAEMLTSNLGEGGISQQEILRDISVLKELAILQESMEWFSGRISEFASELRRPLVNDLNTLPNGAAISTIKDGTIKVLTNIALEFDELANTCLLVLHLEVRVQCFHYLRTNTYKSSNDGFLDSKDILEPDRPVQILTKRLREMDEAFSATLHPRKTKYIFEGLAHLAARILIQASNYLEHIDHVSMQRMCRNALALQQTLSNITGSREVALDQAKQFYELLSMEPDVILSTLVEQGSQFTEMQYLNALHLSCKALGITDANTLGNYQQKLSDILGNKPSPGVVI